MAQAGERRIAEICVVGDGDGALHALRRLPPAHPRIRRRRRPIVHVAGPEGVRATFRLAALLPELFGPGHLKA